MILEAEGMGFTPPAFMTAGKLRHVSAKSWLRSDLEACSPSRSLLVVPRHGGKQQGQKRDKSIPSVSTPKGALYTVGFLVLAVVSGISLGGREGAADGRGQRKVRSVRGLPDEQTLREMAELYLEFQTKAWPKLARKGVFPAKSAASVSRTAAEFSARFCDQNWKPVLPEMLRGSGIEVAEVYLRYSCDNSNPRSLPQQLKNCLKSAEAEDLFVPWELVFADAAVTGTDANRRGYEMAKATISTKTDVASVLVIDELGRASRDMLESLKLGRLVEESSRRLIGATDGFDSMKPQSKMMLTIFAMLHELFVDQLRAKVQRGMHDAFERGKNIRPAAFGYHLAPVLDGDGSLNPQQWKARVSQDYSRRQCRVGADNFSHVRQ